MFLEKVGWFVNDVDLWEINEVFVMVIMFVINELKFDESKVNVNGGVCVFGYLIGVSGVCILVILIYVLKNCGFSKGVVLLCIGGGEVVVMVVEVI